MPPNKVTKQKKVAGRKAPTTKSQCTEVNFRFLWVCLQEKNGKVPDWKAVAEKLDSTTPTVKWRYYMLKDYFGRMEGEAAVGTSGQEDAKNELELESKEVKKVKETPVKVKKETTVQVKTENVDEA